MPVVVLVIVNKITLDIWASSRPLHDVIRWSLMTTNGTEYASNVFTRSWSYLSPRCRLHKAKSTCGETSLCKQTHVPDNSTTVQLASMQLYLNELIANHNGRALKQEHFDSELKTSPVFTALHGMQTRSSDKKAVRPSAKRMDCDKMEKDLSRFLTPYERSFSLVFWEEEWLVGATPTTWNFR